jgi:hypothetical protein
MVFIGSKEIVMSNKYPDGQLNENDRGSLAIELLVKDDRLVINFMKSVIWIGFDREAAIRFGEKIVEIAKTINAH